MTKQLPAMHLEMTDKRKFLVGWSDQFFRYHVWISLWDDGQWKMADTIYKNTLNIKSRAMTHKLSRSAKSNTKLNAQLETFLDQVKLYDMAGDWGRQSAETEARLKRERWVKVLKEAFATIKTAPQDAVDEAFKDYDKEYQAALILIRQHGGAI